MGSLDEFEKIFCGTWKHDRDNNLEAYFDHIKSPEADRKFGLEMKPTITMKRDGDSIIQIWELKPGSAVEMIVKLGVEYENKDTQHTPPLWHNKVLPTFDGTGYRQEVRSLLPAPQNINYVHTATVSGDELTRTLTGLDDTSVSATRIFKRVN